MDSELIIWSALFVQMIVIILLCRLIVNFLNKLRNQSVNPGVQEMLIPGQKAPFFREVDQNNNMVSLSDTKYEYTILLFGKRSCKICNELYNVTQNLQIKRSKTIIITEAEKPEVVFHSDVSLIESKSIFLNYKVKSTPTVIIVDSSGTIISVDIVKSGNNFINLINKHIGISYVDEVNS